MTNPPFGYYALQPGSDDVLPAKSNRRISEADLRRSAVAGLTIRIHRDWISKPSGWDFSFVDSCVALCRKVGKPYTLLLMAGAPNPASKANLAFYEQAATALGARYASDNHCAGVHVTGASNPGTSEELHWKRPMPAAAIAGAKRMIDAWARAFPSQTLLLAIAGGDPTAMEQLISYGLAKYPGRFLVKNNALKQSTSLAANHNKLVVNAGKRGALVGFEMVGPSSDTKRFGPGGVMAGVNRGKDMLRGAGLNPEQAYYAIYPPDLGGLK